MTAGPLPFTVTDHGVRLSVRLTPRAKRDAVAGLVDAGEGRTALAVRLTAPPVEGAANRALIAFLARTLKLPRSAIAIVAGDRSRLKTVEIAGADAAAMLAMLAPRDGGDA